MWILFLNDMRSAHIEDLTAALRAPTRRALEDALVREEVNPYRDGQWNKVFRAGGPLEWFNKPWSPGAEQHFLDAAAWKQNLIAKIETKIADWMRLPEA